MTNIITAGSAYTDIDVLACAVAYRQCLELQGLAAEAVLRAPFNETIPASIRQLKLPVAGTAPEDPEGHSYVLVDVSDPGYFESFVREDRVVEVLDHHFGWEQYWSDRLGDKGWVQHVGSCATLVWERFKQQGVGDSIGRMEARLLYTAIFANTLNCKAAVTTQRDLCALQELEPYGQLPEGYIANYYTEVEEAILEDLASAIAADTKNVVIAGQPMQIGQLELWSVRDLLADPSLLEQMRSGLSRQGNLADRRLLILSEVATGCTYLMSDDSVTREWIGGLLGVSFEGPLAKADRLWMRKEILRELQSLANEVTAVGSRLS